MRLHETLALFSDIIQSYEVVQYDVAGASSRLKISIVLNDSSELHVRDIVIDGQLRKYAFHWQDSVGHLLLRWDNAAHWPQINTYPHHKHVGETGEVAASDAVTLEEVLAVIRKQMKP